MPHGSSDFDHDPWGIKLQVLQFVSLFYDFKQVKVLPGDQHTHTISGTVNDLKLVSSICFGSFSKREHGVDKVRYSLTVPVIASSFFDVQGFRKTHD